MSENGVLISLFCQLTPYVLGGALLRFSKTINLVLPPSGTEKHALDNDDTWKFSIRMCWPRVQPDPFWPLLLHIFHWCTKQYSEGKNPSVSVEIIIRPNKFIPFELNDVPLP